MGGSYFSENEYWIAVLDLFLFITILALLVYIIIKCFVVTPVSYTTSDCIYSSSDIFKYPYNDTNQRLITNTSISPGFIDTTESGTNNVNIFLTVESKDKIGLSSNEKELRNIEELTTSSTLKTLPSNFNNKEIKKKDVQQEGGKIIMDKKNIEVNKSITNSSFVDPSTIGYTTSGEPLSIVSSKCTSNHK
ncbi:Hypothetical protein SRAE_2000318800 [Strongyloides ratti]|uniref:Uncharacterized protein n=1 Tax=Strongyloides ratti TaxID=34506 RepID=A0A090LFI9_STRRB|nr:Hypothetical protein SRAE_2000318800 [Strongyloides ratti]CEF68532.1 Hypothetical protein SRAE_2000318800 [Strongyloides ratti]